MTTATETPASVSSLREEFARLNAARATELLADIRSGRLESVQQRDATHEYFWHQAQAARLRGVVMGNRS